MMFMARLHRWAPVKTLLATGFVLALLHHPTGVHGSSHTGNDGYHATFVPGFTDPNQFKFEWKRQDDRVQLRLTVKTEGWLAVGICEPGSGGMAGTDMAVGHVGPNGTGHVKDYYATGHAQPLMDANQDWRVVSAGEANGWTTMELSRLLVTPDAKVKRQDRAVVMNTRHATRLAFAYGRSDPKQDGTFGMHTEKVNFVVYLGRDPSYSVEKELEAGANDSYLLNTASPFKTFQGRMFREQRVAPGDQAPLTVTRETDPFLLTGNPAPPKGAYYNVAFKIPGLAGRTLTGYTTAIRKESRKYIHHFVLIEMVCPSDDDLEYLPHSHAGGGIQLNQLGTLAEWIPGADEQLFVTEQGVSSGFVFGHDCVIANYHFDNLPEDRALEDDTGLKIYVSDTAPVHQRANLEIADGLVQTRVPIKGGQYSQFVYDCPAKFTSYVVPADGVKVDAAVLHMHGTGQYMRTSFARNGVVYKELEIEYFHIEQQQRLTFEPFELRKGDTITTTCIYKPHTAKDVHFGLYAADEMCITWLEHYPAMQLSIPGDLFEMAGDWPDFPVALKCVYQRPISNDPFYEPTKIQKFRADMSGTFRAGGGDRKVKGLPRQFPEPFNKTGNGAGMAAVEGTLLVVAIMAAGAMSTGGLLV